METKKAYQRRLDAGWFDHYIKGEVIDIGCGRFGSLGVDPITPDCERHDIDICDAHTMKVYEDGQFDTVYTSHILEHLERPEEAIKHWWRILKTGGHLIISVPDIFSYERRLELPSRWNPDHKTMWSFGYVPYSWVKELKSFICGCEIDNYEVVYYGTANTCTNCDNLTEHGNGEYSIEIILLKKDRKIFAINDNIPERNG
jgi:SAM-dependent methyltransferase